MKISKFNQEGYKDTTPYVALKSIKKEEAQKNYMPLTYVCSPYSGNVKENVANARKYSRFTLEKGCIPMTPHLLYPQFMDDDDNAERELSRHINYVLLGNCDELWVFGNKLSGGMVHEIEIAEKRKLPIRWFDDDMQEVPG